MKKHESVKKQGGFSAVGKDVVKQAKQAKGKEKPTNKDISAKLDYIIELLESR